MNIDKAIAGEIVERLEVVHNEKGVVTAFIVRFESGNGVLFGSRSNDWMLADYLDKEQINGTVSEYSEKLKRW